MCPTWIVFHSFRSGDLEIFRLDGVEGSEGVQPINLSNDGSMDSRRAVLQQSVVVFQSDPRWQCGLYLTDSDGKSQSRLTDTQSNNINAMFGPDNQSVIYQSDRTEIGYLPVEQGER